MSLVELYWLLLWNGHQFVVLLYCSVRVQHGLLFYRPPAEPKVQIFLGFRAQASIASATELSHCSIGLSHGRA